MTLFDFRADFSRGRTGLALEGREDAEAYYQSVAEAENMMVTSAGDLRRRWGTMLRQPLITGGRCESWDYGTTDTEKFVLIFEDGALTILDMTMAVRYAGAVKPWTTATLPFVQLSFERETCVITDRSFQPFTIIFDPAGGTFSFGNWSFSVKEDGTRLQAPFFGFAPENEFKLHVHMPAGLSTGYDTYYQQAFQSIWGAPPIGTCSAGTGEIEIIAGPAYFDVSTDVGKRMRFLDGELEITAVTSSAIATVSIKRAIAKNLDTNPFWCRKSSSIVEVAWQNHGLKVGDGLWFMGLAAGDALTLLNWSSPQATSTVAAPVPPAGAANAYVIKRIVDEHSFEVEGAGTVPANDGLSGGGDVLAIPFVPLKNALEPVFSARRGWPQASVFHERRLWLGGSAPLPDSVFGSRFNDITNMDPAEGDPDDAVQMFGIGAQEEVRHLVSAFDLQILTDKAVHYVPGNTNSAITQETVRVARAAATGSSYTVPRGFDGATFYVDRAGRSIRELHVESHDKSYMAPVVSIPVNDWVTGPVDTCVYEGSLEDKTPYLIFVNEDGSLVVMHSSKADKAFGFMRWTLEGATFESVTAVGSRLFAIGKWETGLFPYHFLEFDTSTLMKASLDFAVDFTLAPPGTAFTSSPTWADKTVFITDELTTYEVTLDPTGAATLPEPVLIGTYGLAMPWSFEMHAAAGNVGRGRQVGKMQRLVSAEVLWEETSSPDAKINGQVVLRPEDGFTGWTGPLVPAPGSISGWRTYRIGKWGRAPRLTASGRLPGRVKISSGVLNVHV